MLLIAIEFDAHWQRLAKQKRAKTIYCWLIKMQMLQRFLCQAANQNEK